MKPMPLVCCWKFALQILVCSSVLAFSSCVNLPTEVSVAERHLLMLSRPSLPGTTQARPTQTETSLGTPRTAGAERPLVHVRPLRASGTATARHCVVVDAQGQMDEDMSMEWFQPPAVVIGDALVHSMGLSDSFAAALPAGSRTRATMILEGDLTTFHVESETMTAVVVLRLHMLDDQGTLLSQAECVGRVQVLDLQTKSLTTALAKATDMALEQARTHHWR